jgi:hypothetical protein
MVVNDSICLACDVDVSMDEDSSTDDGSDASVHDHDDPDIGR